MKNTVILFLLTLILSPLCAQEELSAEKLKVAGEIIELNGTIQNLKRAVNAHAQRCEVLMGKYLSRAKDQNAAEKVKTELRKAIDSEMNTAKIQEEIAKVYAGRFSLEELKAIAAFYHSPAGQKMLLLNPDLTLQINELLRNHSKTVDKKAVEILKRKVPTQVPTEAHFMPIGKIPAQSSK